MMSRYRVTVGKRIVSSKEFKFFLINFIKKRLKKPRAKVLLRKV